MNPALLDSYAAVEAALMRGSDGDVGGASVLCGVYFVFSAHSAHAKLIINMQLHTLQNGVTDAAAVGEKASSKSASVTENDGENADVGGGDSVIDSADADTDDIVSGGGVGGGDADMSALLRYLQSAETSVFENEGDRDITAQEMAAMIAAANESADSKTNNKTSTDSNSGGLLLVTASSALAFLQDMRAEGATVDSKATLKVRCALPCITRPFCVRFIIICVLVCCVDVEGAIVDSKATLKVRCALPCI
jgi:hypothetical protein